jgi:hypothetical protein
MNPRVEKVEALDSHFLALEFDNGKKGIFDMRPYFQYPVFQPLRDITFFKKAHVTMGFVSWDGEIDMSPDTLYLDSKIL